MALPEKLLTIIGDEEKAKALETALGEFFVGKTAYNDLNAKFKQANTDLTTANSELETLKTSNLSESEKLTKQMKALEDQQKALAVQKNKMDVERLFVGKGIAEDSYSELLETMVTENSESTMKMANLFLKQMETLAETKAQAVKEELLKGAPPAGAGKGAPKTQTEEDKVRALFNRQPAVLTSPSTPESV